MFTEKRTLIVACIRRNVIIPLQVHFSKQANVAKQYHSCADSEEAHILYVNILHLIKQEQTQYTCTEKHNIDTICSLKDNHGD